MRFLRLASSEMPGQPRHPLGPYAIDVSVSAATPMVAISEGRGHGAAGGAFTVLEALEAHWRTRFERAGGLWLLPYLERMAAGERVEEAELIDAYRARSGREPEAYEWNVPGR